MVNQKPRRFHIPIRHVIIIMLLALVLLSALGAQVSSCGATPALSLSIM